MYLTSKQLEIIRVIVEANPDGKPTDLDEILERANYKPSKQSVQFTIRSLVGHGLIEKVGAERRRGRQRVLIGPTDLGRHFAPPRRPSAFVSSVAEADLISDLEGVL